MRKNVLITGASSGIGAAFAKVAAAHGNNLVLVARREDKLENLAKNLEKDYGITAHTIVSNLVESGEPEKVFESAEKSLGSVDVMINNAGFGDYGEFQKSSIAKNAEMIELNCKVLTEFSYLASNSMTARSGGYICNVASVAGFVPGPYMAVYYATKSYVLSFSQAIAFELKPKNVVVSALCPGPTRTEFENNSQLKNKGIFDKNKRLPSANEVARYGWDSLFAQKPIAIHGFGNRLSMSVAKFLPRNTLTKLVARIQNKDG